MEKTASSVGQYELQNGVSTGMSTASAELQRDDPAVWNPKFTVTLLSFTDNCALVPPAKEKYTGLFAYVGS